MRHLKRSFVRNIFLSFAVLSSSCGMVKKDFTHTYVDSIEYSSNPKTHSRALVATNKELIIAASDGVVYFYPKESKSIYTMFHNPTKEYRDIIFNNNKIVILGIGDSSEVTSYKLEKSDKLFKTPFDGVFLDGMASSGNTIFMMGDPLNNKFSLYVSKDWGESWQSIENSPFAFNDEAGFAASGTNVYMSNESTFSFVSGGDSSRYFLSKDGGLSWYAKSMGFESCKTCGAYSFTYFGRSKIVAVGGDYLKPDEGNKTCRISKDGGRSWKDPKKNPNGYRSNVTSIKGVLYACGTNGIDYSKNNGKTWYSFAKGNYFTLCEFDGKLAASSVKGSIHLFTLL